MVILTTSTSPQTFKFIPRNKTYDGLYITDESTNVETTVSISSNATNDYYESITATFALVESRFYKLVIKNGTDIVYRGRIFCTDQTISNFSVNTGTYTPNVTTNDFIMYE